MAAGKLNIILNNDKKLTKSQYNKLKKLEEKKEKQQLLSKSLQILDKCKISEDAHALLWSSHSIGQAETAREKRRRLMQSHKAGLNVSATDTATHRLQVGSFGPEPPLELADKNADFKVELLESPSSSCLRSNLGGLKRIAPSAFIEYVPLEVSCDAVKVETGTLSLHQFSDCSNNTDASAGELNVETRVDTYATRCVGGDPNSGLETASTLVHVSRPKDVESGRMDLPIIMMEQEIMETVNNNNIVIISGETGCGKTTQVPQFLYEAGYGSGKCPMRSGVIGITLPRRVAVRSAAKRVAYELGFPLGKEVGYQVRHDRKVGENCSMKFMTDGILLQELKSDVMLKHYSVIILDEAHERSVNTDILVGMLSIVIKERQAKAEKQRLEELAGKKHQPHERVYPLKFILMSATLRVENFTSGKIFPDLPPIINIPTKQFPVTTHFSKKTQLKDYIHEAYRKVLKIHKRLPSGGILVFVTGQMEVEDLCYQLSQASRNFVSRSSESSDVTKESDIATVTGMGQIGGYSLKESDKVLETVACSFNSGEDSDSDIGIDSEDQKYSKVDNSIVDFNEAVDTKSLKTVCENLTEETASLTYFKNEKFSATEDVYAFQPSSLTTQKAESKGPIVGPLHVLPLYAKLPEVAQFRVFEEIKEGERLVVVATNVAETSLTIPGIRYVVDTGREKAKEYNPSNGMDSYKIKWISKASASQRAGRAGRTGPGHCYCLYSSAALSNLFPDFSTPEILKSPLDHVVLQLESIVSEWWSHDGTVGASFIPTSKKGKSAAANFPFPTPPEAKAIEHAEKRLMILEAFDSECRMTRLGKAMAQYPIGPRHSRMLLYAIKILKSDGVVRRNLVLGYAAAVAAALSFDNPFLFEGNQISSVGKEQGEDSGVVGSQRRKVQLAKLTTKQMKESVEPCPFRTKVSSLKSDAITVANNLQLFEQSKSRNQLCQKYLQHREIMEAMSKLRMQLLEIVFRMRDHGPEFSWSHGTIEDVENSWAAVAFGNYPLSQAEEDILCQAICAGWIDRVAKCRRRGACCYQASFVDEKVFLGRSSSVYKTAPEFLVYNELLCTNRPYICGATSVKPEWLEKLYGSLCTYSKPLADLKPLYDPLSDQVFDYAIPYFGRHLWQLPLTRMQIKDFKQRTIVFAYALLDGQVLLCLKSVKHLMVSPPSSILRSESEGQKRVGNLISKLKCRTIDSLAKLKEAWIEDPHLLYMELRDFFQKGYRLMFDELWKIMLQEAFSELLDCSPHKIRKRKCRVGN